MTSVTIDGKNRAFFSFYYVNLMKYKNHIFSLFLLCPGWSHRHSGEPGWSPRHSGDPGWSPSKNIMTEVF